MKLNRFNPATAGRVSDFDAWLRNPFAGFATVSHLLGAFPERLSADAPYAVPADVYEDESAYYAHFEIPGVPREDVKVELREQALSLSATRRQRVSGGESTVSLARTVSVPQGVDSDAISAKLENGILRVTLPKSLERRPKTIEIA